MTAATDALRGLATAHWPALEAFFAAGLPRDPLLWRDHDPWLVALSVLVSIGTSAIALHLAGLAKAAKSRGMRQLALGSGALALGSGVWAMHYVGMLAFAVCGQARFDPLVTALSVLPSLAASWVALRLLVRERVGPGVLLAGGVLVGAGIGAMHYLGMAASAWAPMMRYDPGMFALSIVVAVLLAMLALWVRFGLRRHLRLGAGATTLLAGGVMGLAIAGMHYTGMAALRFVQPISVLEAQQAGLPLQATLALVIAVVTVGLGLLGIAVNVSLRYRRMFQDIQRSESRLRAVTATAVDGIVVIDGRGTIQSFNPAAERMFGWRADEVIGRNVHMLMPEPHRSAHDGYLRRHLQTGHTAVIGTGREVEARRRDGTVFPMRLAVGRIEHPDEPLFVGFLVDLSERKALERERQQGQAQLQSLVANLPGIAFRGLNQDGRPMLFISDAVEALTGWREADFIAGRISFAEVVHPEDGRRVPGEIEQAVRAGRPYQVEYRIRTRAGEVRWISENGRGVADEHGVVRWIDGVALDITEAKARQAEFVGVVQALDRSMAVAEFDLDGRIITANANFLALMGYRLEEIVGRHHAVFCTPDYAASVEYRQFWLDLAHGNFRSGEFQRVGKGGRPVWIQATYNPVFDAEGRVSRIIKFATDLSERRAMEQDLRTAKEHAEQAAAARASFLANMSHEIRTPMNAILGFTEALLDSPLEADQRRHLQTVQNAARSLLRLLNDVLDTAKLDKGALALESLEFDLRAVCVQTLDTLRIAATSKGLALRLEYPPALPAHTRGDALRVQQVLLNLLGNAIKFTERGEVVLRVGHAGGEWMLEVSDTGIGMDAAALDTVFAPFAQADASTARRFGGTGLGTTIARQLVELMGGRIEVRSQPGEGSTFSVYLPLPVVAAPRPQAASQASVAGLPALDILAVDDVPANLELLQVTLGREGQRLVLADSGEAALAAHARQRFDLLLLDLQMPGIDGFEVARRIRALEQRDGLPRLPIIALSASVLEHDRERALAAGMDGFAHKPLELPRLRTEIARVLGLHERGEDRPASAAQAAGAPAAVDWDTGVRRWGSRALLQQALAGFLREQARAPARLQAAQDDPAALAALAHRLRGAAGNLALQQLQAALEMLENAARAGDAGAIAQGMARIGPAWREVQEALGEPEMPLMTEAAAHDPDAACAAIDAALPALQRGELPDAALARLAQALQGALPAAVQEALDGFDFEAAQAALQALRASLRSEP